MALYYVCLGLQIVTIALLALGGVIPVTDWTPSVSYVAEQEGVHIDIAGSNG